MLKAMLVVFSIVVALEMGTLLLPWEARGTKDFPGVAPVMYDGKEYDTVRDFLVDELAGSGCVKKIYRSTALVIMGNPSSKREGGNCKSEGLSDFEALLALER